MRAVKITATVVYRRYDMSGQTGGTGSYATLGCVPEELVTLVQVQIVNSA